MNDSDKKPEATNDLNTLRARLDKIENEVRAALAKGQELPGAASKALDEMAPSIYKAERIAAPVVAKVEDWKSKLLQRIVALLKSHCATLWAACGFVYNKAFAIMILYGLAQWYLKLTSTPAAKEHGVPFVELLYAAVIIGGVAVAGPFLRLLVFPEVARYAESGKIREDICGDTPSVTPALKHYWIATVGCYAVATIAMAMAMHFGS